MYDGKYKFRLGENSLKLDDDHQDPSYSRRKYAFQNILYPSFESAQKTVQGKLFKSQTQELVKKSSIIFLIRA